jgi:hypothetical protein
MNTILSLSKVKFAMYGSSVFQNPREIIVSME